MDKILGAGWLPPGGESDSESMETMERSHILRILDNCNWRIRGTGGAADRLGINPSTLRSRMKKLGIHRPA